MLTIVAGIASAKIAALLVGPSGVGLVGMVQGAAAVAAAAIELGMATAIVRIYGADIAETGDNHDWLMQLTRVALRLMSWLAGGVMAVSVALGPWLAGLVLGDGRRAYEFTIAAATGVAVSFTTLHTSVLVAAHQVKSVVTVAVRVAFVSPVVTFAVVGAFGEAGVAPAALVSSCVVLGITVVTARRRLAQRASEQAHADRRGTRRRLVSDGVPVCLSAVTGSVALVLVPLAVRHLLGDDAVGFYRAAAVISLGYTAAISAAVNQDFLPRASRVASSPAAVTDLALAQVRLVTFVLVPVLAATSALLPAIVRVLYRRDFAPTVDVLEWQLVGDVLRMISSVLAASLFVLRGGAWRLGTELAGLLLLVVLSTVGAWLDGLSGLGGGFVATYLLYAAILCAALASSGIRGSRDVVRTIRLVLAGTAVVALPAVLTRLTDVAQLRLIGLAAAATWLFVAYLQRQRIGAPSYERGAVDI
jgi:O-antigen/teichoic acid export membrane protein